MNPHSSTSFIPYPLMNFDTALPKIGKLFAHGGFDERSKNNTGIERGDTGR
jgi:hypothetical protein